MTPDEIRRELRAAQRQRERAERLKAEAVARQRELLLLIPATRGVSMTEAASILKMSRRGAYTLRDGWSVKTGPEEADTAKAV